MQAVFQMLLNSILSTTYRVKAFLVILEMRELIHRMLGSLLEITRVIRHLGVPERRLLVEILLNPWPTVSLDILFLGILWDPRLAGSDGWYSLYMFNREMFE